MFMTRKQVLPGAVVASVSLSLFSLLFPTGALAQKTDVIHLKNGDQVTAEIKELIRGEMRLKTDAFGTIYVKWQDVDRIESNKRMQVQLINGRRYFGRVHSDQESSQLNLEIGGSKVILDSDQVILAQTIKGEERPGNWDNSMSLGFTYTKASDVTQWSATASTSYRTEKYLASASYDSLITNNQTGTDGRRSNLSGNYYRFRQNRWLWFANAGYQRNDSLGIEGRVSAAGGIGRYLLQSQSQDLLLAGGLNGNFENGFLAADDSNSSLEALLFAEWRFYKLKTPKADLSVSFDLFPSLTESDRLRGDLSIQYRQEFIQDLFWNLRYFDNFDTNPPEGAASKRDYGLVTSLEYRF